MRIANLTAIAKALLALVCKHARENIAAAAARGPVARRIDHHRDRAGRERRHWRAAGRPILFSFGLALSLGGCGQLPMMGVQVAYTTSDGAVSAAAAQRMISAYRASHGLSPVTLDPALHRVAQAQARSMAQVGQISHGPRSLSSRLASQGVNPRAAAENVAAGYQSLERVMASWRNSSGHRANLLMPEARRVGIALAHAPDTRFKTYWALVVTD